MAINTLEARQGGERVAKAEDAFRAAQKKCAIRRQAAADVLENAGLGRLVKIDQHIATQDDVELAQRREILKQVEWAEADGLTNLALDAPIRLLLVEMPDQHLDRKAALHLEGRIA